MDQPEPATVTLAEAAKLVGVSTSTLRHLAEHGALPGTIRIGRGQVRVRAAALPTFDEVEAALLARMRTSIIEVRKHYDRVKVELEAVGNDIVELEDDPTSQIGVDLEAFDQLSTRAASTLQGALRRMSEANMFLRLERRALDDMRLRY